MWPNLNPLPAITSAPAADDVDLLEAVGCVTCGQPIVNHERTWWHDPNRRGHVIGLPFDRDGDRLDANHPAKPHNVAELRRLAPAS